MVKSKKAVSDIVATVLIIMITVAAVGIIGAIVVPMVRESLTGGTLCSEAISDLYIDSVSGFSCWDEKVDLVSVKISRMKPGVSLYSGAKIEVSSGGNSYSYIVESNFINPSEVISLNVSQIDPEKGIQEISLYPLIKMSKGEKECDKSSSIKIEPCTLNQIEPSKVINKYSLGGVLHFLGGSTSSDGGQSSSFSSQN